MYKKFIEAMIMREVERVYDCDIFWSKVELSKIIKTDKDLNFKIIYQVLGSFTKFEAEGFISEITGNINFFK